MFPHTELTALKALLDNPKKISIVSHRNPDGDAMGSSLGLLLFLKELKHDVTFISPNHFPDYLAWLPDAENIVVFDKEVEKATTILNDSDLIFTLDFNAFHRTGEQLEKVLASIESVPFIMIDHHQAPQDYAAFTFSDVKYGSTCEMVYDFINALGYNEKITTNCATAIYTGIVTDSGSFRFPKTTSNTHVCVADLINKGIDNGKIHANLFDNSTYQRLQLLGKALQNLVLLPEYNTSYISLSQDELDKYNYQKGDTEGIVNYGLNITGIDFTAIFIEHKEEGLIKISFRSQGSFDVNEFARNHFEGGGHINAAGGKSFLNLQDTITQFIAILAKEKI